MLSAPIQSNQSGFVLMILVVILVVGSAAYFASTTKNLFSSRESAEDLERMVKLNKIREKLLNFAVFQPELYQSNNPGTITNADFGDIPGPGYLPCPDTDGNGDLTGGDSACGNPRVPTDNTTGFVIGFLPQGIAGRNSYFSSEPPRSYYYVVDERFVFRNPRYNSAGAINIQRYTPLNSTLTTPASVPNNGVPALTNGVLPWLSINGQEQFVALIIDPGPAQTFPDGSSQSRAVTDNALTNITEYLDRRFNRDGALVDAGNQNLDRFFFDASGDSDSVTVNDRIIGITFEEWRTAVEERVCARINQLRGLGGGGIGSTIALDPLIAHWFNAYDAANNPIGSDWRAMTGTGVGEENICDL